MSNNEITILLGKPGLDGHDVGVKVLAQALIDEGFKVVYSGLRKSLEEIVEKAVDCQADIIGLSILSGTHLIICKKMKELMDTQKMNTPWIVGGNIPQDDVEKIKSLGVTAAFPTGTTVKEVVSFMKNKTGFNGK